MCDGVSCLRTGPNSVNICRWGWGVFCVVLMVALSHSVERLKRVYIYIYRERERDSYIYIYIYTLREKERERERGVRQFVYIYIYICIYIYIYRDVYVYIHTSMCYIIAEYVTSHYLRSQRPRTSG